MDCNLYSDGQSQQLHLQNKRRCYTAEEYIREEEDDDCRFKDPHYEYFLENLRPNGKSYELHIIEDNVVVKYHDESANPEALIDCEAENANHVSDAPVNYVGKRRGRKPKGPKHHADKSGDGNGKHVASEAQKPESTPSSLATRVKEENEDYDDAAPSKRRPVQDPVLNFWNDDEANAMKLTKYREKLMEELKMPYCEEEYGRLLKDITVRKPVQGKRELRRIKIYGENYDGKSLLDHHIDLKKKIDSARDDHPKVLNLLRGFFYWLKNLSHEGAFMPWRDPSCLDVLS